jgi:hypothetical protein
MTEEIKQQEMPATPEAAEAESSDLNVNDLNAMKTIIDIASSRGAFKPNEMIAVGQVYTKLTKFLSSVTKQQGN